METKTRETLWREWKTQRQGWKAARGGRCWHPFRYKSGGEALPRLASVQKRSQFRSHAKPWLKTERVGRAAPPGAHPRRGGGVGGDDQVPWWFRYGMNDTKRTSQRSVDGNTCPGLFYHVSASLSIQHNICILKFDGFLFKDKSKVFSPQVHTHGLWNNSSFSGSGGS